jgi:hypothetical protein
MAAKLAWMTHKIVIQLHLVAESCTICGSHTRQLIGKLLDTPSYINDVVISPLETGTRLSQKVNDFFPLSICTKEEMREVIRFLFAEGVKPVEIIPSNVGSVRWLFIAQ